MAMIKGLYDPNVLIEDDVKAFLAVQLMDYHDCFLAGGYLRDRILGLKPKDVDLFTFQDALPGRTFMNQNQGSDLGAGRVKGVEILIDPVEFLLLADGLIDTKPMMPYPAQMVHLDPEWANDRDIAVSQFALGIQQCCFNIDEGTIEVTEAFQQDLKNRTMTICRVEGTGQAYSLWKKISDLRPKFPDWKVIIPKEHWSIYKDIVESDFADYTIIGAAE